MALNARGFTLSEAVIASSVVGLVLLVTSSLLVNTIRFNQQAGARAAIQRDARVFLDGISREVSQARGHTIVVDRFDSSQPPYSRLTFSQIGGRSVSYYQLDRRLYRRVSAGGVTATALLADGVRQASFAYPRSDVPGLVSISLIFERTAAGAKYPLAASLSRVRVQNPDAY